MQKHSSRAKMARTTQVPDREPSPDQVKVPSLLETAREIRTSDDQKKNNYELGAEEQARFLEAQSMRKKLTGHSELARDIHYGEPLKRSWRAPKYILEQSDSQQKRIRKHYHVVVEGEHVPPIIPYFQDMKVPRCIVEHLEHKNIKRPSPIQMQCLPAAFSGRDIIGIASTGSGKTLTFCLPLILFAAEAEHRCPYEKGDGPLGMILCPSRELARQTHDYIETIAEVLEHGGYARIRSLLCIGGINMADQSYTISRGIHIVVATPGRLQDMLERKRLRLDLCNYLCLDEADRMMDMGFEEDVRNIMTFFTQQRQTLLFSATMPKKILEFAEQSLIKPVIVNVGRAGAASLDVIQEVEYVEPDSKMVYLLETLQKTAPPVIIFSDNKHEVEDVYEYLLRKGVEVVAIHGSKSQEEREYAIESFKKGTKDVMVASGVASKGLDFHGIQHVINYTMPKEIEDYVHQIGRTGRNGKTGIATTFVNSQVTDQTMLDLKYLLLEAKQRVPSFLEALHDPHSGSSARRDACAVCGGLGHNVTQCPKLEDYQRRMTAHFSQTEMGGY
ncbi:Similar to S.cerevisiae protein DBP2 (ATP-dependent RNA helicase of the DEAD-box protein family) [Malassezia sympodialis ATCC 42132]|uniref:RNA helicase n=1 Tax=Malassezia sympodialis (strain ATCC 42132) TaxID=1230383 RepID=A0A1M7ZZY5_MALS4|nr:Similar to S.cerevisiae protein DBP2 (ATP-dependent RNA helicase of the DEAD-box protein family) [Malassezia sympodialis ATCC 42132]